jgi:hypothetical protein
MTPKFLKVIVYIRNSQTGVCSPQGVCKQFTRGTQIVQNWHAKSKKAPKISTIWVEFLILGHAMGVQLSIRGRQIFIWGYQVVKG